MTSPSAPYVWLDGDLVPWDDATTHVLSHGLHYGTGVFEGIRAYETRRGAAFFRLDDHLARLARSTALYYMDLPFAPAELRVATHALVDACGLRECYVRPVAFRGLGPVALDPVDNPVSIAIAAWSFAGYLDAGKRDGVTAMVSSWRRISGRSLVPQAKATGHYLNSMLAKSEANRCGVDVGIMLDDDGAVSEGSAENVFVVRGDALATPWPASNALEGITRDTAMAIARDLGLAVVERRVERAELYSADEVFVTGTAAEITPVRAIDGHDLGPPGEVTRAIQRRYDDAVRGGDGHRPEWLDPLGERQRSDG